MWALARCGARPYGRLLAVVRGRSVARSLWCQADAALGRAAAWCETSVWAPKEEGSEAWRLTRGLANFRRYVRRNFASPLGRRAESRNSHAYRGNSTSRRTRLDEWSLVAASAISTSLGEGDPAGATDPSPFSAPSSGDAAPHRPRQRRLSCRAPVSRSRSRPQRPCRRACPSRGRLGCRDRQGRR